MKHTPTDSLRYIQEMMDLLDVVSEIVTGCRGEVTDEMLEEADSYLFLFNNIVRYENWFHDTSFMYYSTGHPVQVEQEHSHIEKNPETGIDSIVIGKLTHSAYPADGGWKHPLVRDTDQNTG